MQHKDYDSNLISARSSTKRIHEPGGGSSIGSWLFGGGDDAKNNKSKPSKPQQETEKENTDNQNQIKNQQQSQNVVIEQKEDALKSDADKVREFTFEAGQPVPDKPQVMAVDEVNFITKMILDEVYSLTQK